MLGRLPVVFLSLTAALAAPSGPARGQAGYDRLGSDYASFQVRSADPAVCAARCDREPRCRAWSFVYPRPDAPIAMCWLKNRVPPRVESSCCASGIKGAGVIEPKVGAVEFSIDRYGGDYRNLEVTPDPAGRTCAQACEADSRCRAWTYVRPGYIGAAARCYLKDRITRPRRKPCCVSGVVR
ncbi:MAG: PAN domain-containing protein [Xanthobacteraceae bacterium]|nr:PAN domain-containing protein [Xanthobacteraceae bacterium]PWB66164.1 MAG: apple domain-containing protein [Bradyrhizobiaceae bacterium]